MSRKVLVENFLSLVLVQIANYLLPLVTLPYLARVIGVEKFGVISFANAVITYFIILTTFGFNFSAPREISVIRDNKEKLREVFWCVLYSKFFLCLISSVIFVFLLLTVPKFNIEWIVFVFTFFSVIGNAFFPLWFFQGIEKMSYLAIFNFLTKILYAISIFLFIKTKQHYVYVPLFYSISQIISSFGSLFLIIFYFGLKPVLIDLKKIWFMLKDSLLLFISTLSINLYTKIHPVLLGFFAGDIYVGYYSAAERLFYAWLGIQGQLNTTFYPYMSKIAQQRGKGETLKTAKKVLLAMMTLALPSTLITFIFARRIIFLMYGKEFFESIIVLRILSLLFVVVGLSNIFGVQLMLPFNMKKEFSFTTVSAGVANLVFGLLLIPVYKHIGAAVSFFISEVIVAFTMFIILRRKISKFEINESRVEK